MSMIERSVGMIFRRPYYGPILENLEKRSGERNCEPEASGLL